MDKGAVIEQLTLIRERCENYIDEVTLALAIVAMDSSQDMDISRHAEICKAEAEGRLIVLPCDVGDTVYRIIKQRSGDEVIIAGNVVEFSRRRNGNEFYFSKPLYCRYDGWCDIESFGETVFLSRYEAEKALQKVEE